MLHIVELFDRLINEGKITFMEDMELNVTYHDPCHLGRLSERDIEWNGDIIEMMPLISLKVPSKPKKTGSQGVYDSPRNLLNNIPGVKLKEMERIKEYSYCCGAGGGVKSGFPEFAIDTAKNRIKEAEGTNAEFLVSSCPFCATNLKDGIKSSDSKLQFLDISELILMMIEGK
ncbi:MAG: heterodisulfide reductase-related iron-sulfur binding cluster [Candidatus Lokiarchaeota archaeon]